MINIKLDRDMLIQELYKVLSFLDTENIQAKQQLMYIIDLASHAPTDEEKRNYARIKRG